MRRVLIIIGGLALLCCVGIVALTAIGGSINSGAPANRASAPLSTTPAPDGGPSPAEAATITAVAIQVLATPAPATKTPEPPARSFRVGDQANVRVSSGDVLLAADKPAYDEFTKLAVAKDTVGVSRMVLQGRLIAVTSGTLVQVIERDGIIGVRYRVRILEGPHFGEDGWVSETFMQ